MESHLPPPPPAKEKASSMPSPSALDSTLIKLLQLAANPGSNPKWDTITIVNDTPIRRLMNVPYSPPISADPMQKLDIYFPPTHPAVNLPSNLTFLPTHSPPNPLPVLVHIHGGGWARGGKATWAHGAPSICKALCAQGVIAISVGYRLGTYPHFVDDAAMAVGWVRENIASLGGDVNNVYLSGHSAGAHIASLMTVRHERFLKPHNVPPSFIKGLMLISGVYNLFAPLSKALLDVKNKGFVLLYVLPSFGLDRTLRREASPLILLEPDTDVGLAGKVAMAAGAKGWSVPSLQSWSADPAEVEKERGLNKYAAEGLTLNQTELPPCLVFNCQFDVGLQSDGEKMSKALSKYTECRYVYVEKADHGSVCWTAKTHKEMVDFMFKIYKS
ncbi:hypothetical protein TrLO_g2983 [Triparma laevis f. longispina]|uniref:BD-FAE-like domain-containing protein n=1 Tax=Triparma laevis f. longispina TaxID=1714387 RepID=A0A9W7A1V5_9STRA|nr:hypothetical protein TrLO_g2983 [Triparma laevis f. longispina]